MLDGGGVGRPLDRIIRRRRAALSTSVGKSCPDLGGYFVGYIGEQVVVTILTGAVAKVGLVGKALARGAQAADDLIAIARAAAGPAADTAEAVQKLSKGLANDYARVARSATRPALRGSTRHSAVPT